MVSRLRNIASTSGSGKEVFTAGMSFTGIVFGFLFCKTTQKYQSLAVFR
jgi:hypothetical protein